jgi:hypothetical protein
MKQNPYTKTIPVALLTLFSCGKNPTPMEKSSAHSIKEPYDCGIKIEEIPTYIPQKPAEISMLYVINPNSARQFEKPDTNSAILGKYQYADNLWPDRMVDTIIKGKKSSWYIIDEHIIKTKHIDNADYSTRVSSMVFVRKEDLGSESKIMLNNNELYEVWNKEHQPSLNSKRQISIRSLTHDEFYQAPKPNDWVRTSYTWAYDAVVDKIDLKLDRSDSLLHFRNVPFQAETDFHVYMEDIESLNCYMVFGAYYENHRFLLYDKASGESKASLIGYPCISPNKKHIASFYDDPYGDGGGKLEIHAITPTGPYKLLKSFNFIHWRPFEDPMEFVWLNDKEFKIKVYTEYKHFRKWEGKEFAPRTGYLKFRIL